MPSRLLIVVMRRRHGEPVLTAAGAAVETGIAPMTEQEIATVTVTEIVVEIVTVIVTVIVTATPLTSPTLASR